MKLNEAVFSRDKIQKVMQLYRRLFGKYFGGEFKVFEEEVYKRASDKGTGIRLINDSNYQLRFNWSLAQSNALAKKSRVDKTKLYISSIDYWDPVNTDFEKPSATITFLMDINVVQIWQSLAKIIKKGVRGKYTLRDLQNIAKTELTESTNSINSVGSFIDYLNEASPNDLSKSQRSDFMKKAGFKASVAYNINGKDFEKMVNDDADLQAKLDAYVLEVGIGKKETNSTAAKLRDSEKALKEKAYSDPDLVFKDIEDLTTLVAKGGAKSLIVCGQGGVGKCLTNDTRVKTPNGEILMGEIKVGDEVITPKNTIAKVLEVYPQPEQNDCYRVHLSDGRYVDCDDEQIFKVAFGKRSTGIGEYKNLTLLQIKETLEKNKYLKQKKYAAIPYSEAISADNAAELPLDPYVLGLLIGDGTITSGVGFTNTSIPTIEYLREYVESNFENHTLKFRENCENGCDYSIVRTDQYKKGMDAKLEENQNQFKLILKNLGLAGKNSHTKFIPESYKQTTIQNKLELIKGLVDTDGYIQEDGGTSYSTVSEQLAKDFAEIVWSLGGNAKIKKGKVKYKDSYNTSYSVRFTLPFKLGQVSKTNLMKLERYQGRLDGQEFRQHLKIKDIEYIGKKDTTCILIDDPDHLYLVNDYVVVHNTFHITSKLKEILGSQPGPWYYHSGMKASAVSFYMKTFEERKSLIVWDEADSLLTNDDIIMMLKPALDTSGDNTMEYSRGASVTGKSTEEIKELCDEVDTQIRAGKTLGVTNKGEFVHVPAKFYFEGSMIFISNMPAEKIEGAILSRSVFVDVYLSATDMNKRIISIMRHKYSNYSADDLNGIAEALGQTLGTSDGEQQVQYMTPELARKNKPVTVRSLELAIKMKECGLTNWARLASLYA